MFVNSRKTTAERLIKIVKIQVIWFVTPCSWVLYPDVSKDLAAFILRLKDCNSGDKDAKFLSVCNDVTQLCSAVCQEWR